MAPTVGKLHAKRNAPKLKMSKSKESGKGKAKKAGAQAPPPPKKAPGNCQFPKQAPTAPTGAAVLIPASMLYGMALGQVSGTTLNIADKLFVFGIVVGPAADGCLSVGLEGGMTVVLRSSELEPHIHRQDPELHRRFGALVPFPCDVPVEMMMVPEALAQATAGNKRRRLQAPAKVANDMVCLLPPYVLSEHTRRQDEPDIARQYDPEGPRIVAFGEIVEGSAHVDLRYRDKVATVPLQFAQAWALTDQQEAEGLAAQFRAATLVPSRQRATVAADARLRAEDSTPAGAPTQRPTSATTNASPFVHGPVPTSRLAPPPTAHDGSDFRAGLARAYTPTSGAHGSGLTSAAASPSNHGGGIVRTSPQGANGVFRTQHTEPHPTGRAGVSTPTQPQRASVQGSGLVRGASLAASGSNTAQSLAATARSLSCVSPASGSLPECFTTPSPTGRSAVPWGHPLQSGPTRLPIRSPLPQAAALEQRMNRTPTAPYVERSDGHAERVESCELRDEDESEDEAQYRDPGFNEGAGAFASGGGAGGSDHAAGTAPVRPAAPAWLDKPKRARGAREAPTRSDAAALVLRLINKDAAAMRTVVEAIYQRKRTGSREIAPAAKLVAETIRSEARKVALHARHAMARFDTGTPEPHAMQPAPQPLSPGTVRMQTKRRRPMQ